MKQKMGEKRGWMRVKEGHVAKQRKEMLIREMKRVTVGGNCKRGGQRSEGECV